MVRRGEYSQLTSVLSSGDSIPSDDDESEAELGSRLCSAVPRRALRVPRIVKPVRPRRIRAEATM